MSDQGPLTAAEEQELLAAIADVGRHFEDWPFARLADGFRAIEARFSPALRDRPAAHLELERRVAEWIFDAAVARRLPPDEVDRLLDRILQLGFTNTMVRVSVLGAYGGYCAELRRPEPALAHLAPLIAEIAASSSPHRDEDLQFLAAVRARLEAAR